MVYCTCSLYITVLVHVRAYSAFLFVIIQTQNKSISRLESPKLQITTYMRPVARGMVLLVRTMPYLPPMVRSSLIIIFLHSALDRRTESQRDRFYSFSIN